MSHDFLTSLHSTVIDTSGMKKSAEIKRQTEKGQKVGPGKTVSEMKIERKHRTIGVSMSPVLHERAVARAAAIGLSFSRYVQWCLEAELDGSALADRFRSDRD